MEANLNQQIAGILHDPLLQVFLDVQKSYNLLERGRCMDILRGYVLGNKLQSLLQRFWDEQVVVPKPGRLYGRPLVTEIVVTQGDPVFPEVLNVMVDAAVGEFLLEFCGPQEAQHGVVWATGEPNIVLYADCDRIVGRNPIWVQTMLTEVVRM